MNFAGQNFHFVTGRLAEQAVRNIVEQVAARYEFEYSIGVLPITVAALMTPKWLLRHLQIPADTTRVVLPGHLQMEVEQIQSQLAVETVCGPRDIRELPVFFGGKRERDASYGQHSIEIIAEINHADRLTRESLLATAQQLADEGADVIDLGCSPGQKWTQVRSAVQAVRELGLSVSIDSFDSWEVAEACRGGAELVLSVNSSNRQSASQWGVEVVVIPDIPGDEKSFDETINFLEREGTIFRLDPILEPLGCGFTRSLLRYASCRQRYPHAKMMMGIGNITELTDSDSAGINTLLLAMCQELQIQSILTTQVINWARSSVRECDLARRLVHYATTHSIPPKHLEPGLVMLRDERVNEFSTEVLQDLASSIRDKNVRIFTANGEIHAISSEVHAVDRDPFVVMAQLLASPMGDSINPEHAFYLGFEMAKALTANTLSKQYEQDQALNWGFLTRPETHHRLSKTSRRSSDSTAEEL